ncbi:MAG: lipid-A-disaccharide synthase, partial [Proteobacteria bacterium]|nr:lipid-A-disaccharide synthase [Pseudomonadota bacterium]
MSRPLLVYLIAGEPSGDALGAKLMTALRAETGGGVEFAGVGGAMMTAEGLTTLFPMSDLTVMGIAEVLPNILTILSRIRQTAADVAARRADVVVTIDAPDFCFRVAKRLKGKGIPLVHYVAPSVWAWRPGRARKIAALVDHVLCLLPFEPPYFQRVGLTATFVGHSILESGAGSGDGTGFRSRHGIPPSAPLLAVLPGSRGSEITRLLTAFGEIVAVLAAAM